MLIKSTINLDGLMQVYLKMRNHHYFHNHILKKQFLIVSIRLITGKLYHRAQLSLWNSSCFS